LTSRRAQSADPAPWNGQASGQASGHSAATFSSAANASRSCLKENGMDKHIHRENLTLLRRRLAEAQDETTRKVILKLLTEEEAKYAPQLAI
jgi:hypothetical protein